MRILWAFDALGFHGSHEGSLACLVREAINPPTGMGGQPLEADRQTYQPQPQPEYGARLVSKQTLDVELLAIIAEDVKRRPNPQGGGNAHIVSWKSFAPRQCAYQPTVYCCARDISLS